MFNRRHRRIRSQPKNRKRKNPRPIKTRGKSQNYSETYKYLNLFGDVFERVRSEYVEEVADKDLIEYAVNGMLSASTPLLLSERGAF